MSFLTQGNEMERYLLEWSARFPLCLLADGVSTLGEPLSSIVLQDEETNSERRRLYELMGSVRALPPLYCAGAVSRAGCTKYEIK